ncbi:TPA: prephenate dehydrogenase/arogenate dehydrogenase family protein [Candidatus Bathyarchaeota archaeon]|nr:prephenate dehydrogenase/arogenate dehydrogenase family protein [Candidatus Bathyarchaeota archaeon]
MQRSFKGVEKEVHIHEDFGILSKSSIAIVGGTGRMGRMLARLFKGCGGKIIVCSRNFQKAEAASKLLGVAAGDLSAVKEADITIVSVPVGSVVEVTSQVATEMKRGLVMEVSSVKVGVVDKLSSKIPPRLEYLSIHPLFGPRVRGFKGKSVAVIKVREGPLTNAVLKYMERKGLNLVETSAGAHDEKMAVVQVMHHYALLCLGAALANFEPLELTKFSTTLFKTTLAQLKRMAKNLSVVLEIQERNLYGPKTKEKFLMMADFLRQIDKEKRGKIEKWLVKLNKA